MTLLEPIDHYWLSKRLEIATEEVRRLTPDMAIWELKLALADIPGSESMTLGYAANGNQLVTVGDKTVEVGPMASNEEIRLALLNPLVKTENTNMSVTGAKFLAEQIRNQLAAAKAQLNQAGSEMTTAMGNLQSVADAATKQVQEIKAETAELQAALGLNSNGAPE